MLAQDELCELGISCYANGQKIQTGYQTSESRRYYQSIYNNVNRRSGEEFAASGPPACSVRRENSSECKRNNKN